MVSQTYLCSQSIHIEWSSFNMGFTTSSSTTSQIKSVIGLPVVGTTKNNISWIESGFLVDTLFRTPPVGVGFDELLPSRYYLEQNFPNPFNPSTEIRFELPYRANVHLAIYDLLGKQVAVLLDEEVTAGVHNMTWNGLNNFGLLVSSGVYYYRLVTDDFFQTKKLMLLR